MEHVAGDDGFGTVVCIAEVHELQRGPVRGNRASSFGHRSVRHELATDLEEDFRVGVERHAIEGVKRRTCREQRRGPQVTDRDLVVDAFSLADPQRPTHVSRSGVERSPPVPELHAQSRDQLGCTSVMLKSAPASVSGRGGC
jgi:hypothetical protein